MEKSKICPPDKVYNKATNRCVSKTGKIGMAILKGTYTIPGKKEQKKTKKEKECPPDKIYNEATNRCVMKNGKVGKKLLASRAQQKKKKTTVQQKKVQEQQANAVSEDIQILNYGIGKPISVREAMKHFLCEKVNVKKQDLTADGLYLDPITLQELPLTDMVQLRSTGEIMSREVFETYFVNPNTKKWCGKENVGFKSPNGTVFGNLVLYNYDESEGGFFPQKPGTLTITNVSKNQFYRLTYRGFSFYIPHTKEGTVLLCMMKDAFKKGNLFAFSKNGRIRHGRIHKKTSLTGTYGYPDSTYIDRALGELNLLGTSPYVYQFSNDKSYSVGVDPYPAEKRWKISYVP